MADKNFEDYKSVAQQYITSQERPFFPDYLEDAIYLYSDVFELFSQLCAVSKDSADLLWRMHNETGDKRIQLFRVFRKYVSPQTSVEMLKIKSKLEETIENFGSTFRDLQEIREKLALRPRPDEALAAIFWEHHDRGTPGYVLTAHFFDMFTKLLGVKYEIIGHRQAGSDVQLQKVLPKFEKIIPADFLIVRRSDHKPRIIGFARYDSDRGGSQEDDRTGGNQDKVEKIMSYAARRRVPLQVLFVNDGPGLLLGSMWDDYARLESDNIVDDELRVMVVTLKMVPERLTEAWIESIESN
ncbi:MAG: hypothetical protein IID48_10510 [Proteobacteria bacterium]|nr:hypothetical protein [Pseudomonadota bacterium]